MKKILIALVLISSVITSNAQIEGLWNVIDVTVGEEIMTPTAKWTRFKADGSYESGNGWQKNSEGNWSLNKETMELTLDETYDVYEDAPPFIIAQKANTMTWIRMEHGEKVKVNLEKIEEILQAPCDKLVGIGEFKSIDDKENLMERTSQLYGINQIRFRWDKVFNAQLEEGKKIGGFWRPHPHKNKTTLMFFDENFAYEHWKTEFEHNKLIFSNFYQPVTITFEKIE